MVTKPRGVATPAVNDHTVVYDIDLNGDVRSRTDEEGYRTQWDYTSTGLIKEQRLETERGVFSTTTYANFDANGSPQLRHRPARQRHDGRRRRRVAAALRLGRQHAGRDRPAR